MKTYYSKYIIIIVFIHFNGKNYIKSLTNYVKCLTEINIYEIHDFIESSESWLIGKLQLTKLRTVLYSQLDLPNEIVLDDLLDILLNWFYMKGSNGSVDMLDSALKFLGCSQLVG